MAGIDEAQQLRLAARLDEARAVLEGLEQTADVLLERGRIEADSARLDAAEELFGRAQALYNQGGDEVGATRVRGDQAWIVFRHGDATRALQLHRERLATMQRLGERWETAYAQLDVARVLRMMGEPEEAWPLFTEARDTFKKLKDKRYAAFAEGGLARILALQGDTGTALRMQRRRVAAFDKVGDVRGRLRAQSDVAELLETLGRPDEALDLHRERLAAYEAMGDTHSQGVCKQQIGILLLSRGDADDARALFTELTEADDPRLRASGLLLLGRVEHRQGEVEAALDHIQTAELMFRDAGDERDAAIARVDLAEIYETQSDYVRAVAMYEDLLAWFEAHQDLHQKAWVLGKLAGYAWSDGDGDAALSMYEQKLAMYEVIGDPLQRGNTLLELSNIHEERHDFDTVLGQRREALGIFQELENLAGMVDGMNALGRAHYHLGEWERARKLYDGAIKLAKLAGEIHREHDCIEDLAEMLVEKAEEDDDHEAWDEAFALRKRQLYIARRLGDSRGEAIATLHVAEMKAVAADYAGALKLANGLLERSDDDYNRASAHWALSRIYTVKAQDAPTPEDIAAAHRELAQAYDLFKQLESAIDWAFVAIDLAGYTLPEDRDRAWGLLDEAEAAFRSLKNEDKLAAVEGAREILADLETALDQRTPSQT